MPRQLWLACLALIAATAPATARAARPNLLLIIADDCTFRDIGCYGGQAHTPHMDRLANSGQFSIKRDVLFIDGIPRSRAQAEVLADKVDMLLLLHLRADQEPMLERIHKRALQENRLDDANPDVVRRRFQEYEAETAPILDFYPAAKIRTVDAGAAPLEVLRQIIEVLQIMLFPEALQHAA